MIARLIGGLMMGIGILVALSSGLCTLVVVAGSLTSGAGAIGMFPMALLIGAPFIVVGSGFFLWGRQILRNQRIHDQNPPAP